MARVEAVYELRDGVSAKLAKMATGAEALEKRLKSLDREILQKNADLKLFQKEITASERVMARWDRQIVKTTGYLRTLGTIKARPKIELRGYGEASREIAGLIVQLRTLGAMSASPRINPQNRPPLAGGAGPPYRGGGGRTNVPFTGIGGTASTLAGIGLIAGGPIIQGGAGLLGAAGGAIGAAGVGAGAIAPAYAAGGLTYGSLALGGGAVASKLAPAFGAASKFSEAQRSGTAEDQAKAQKELDAALKGLTATEKRAVLGSQELSKAWRTMFAEGARGQQQVSLMARTIDFLGKTGLPLMAEQWDRFFPMFDKNMRSAQRYFESDKGQKEFRSWTKDLPGIADDLMKALGAGGRLFGGFVQAISPLTKDGSRGLADWLGKKADWANSVEGMNRMRTTIDSARPVFKAFGEFVRETGKGFVYLTENGGGRAAAGIFRGLADSMMPFAKFLDDSTASLPAWGQAIKDVGTIVANLFGPGGSFSFALGMLTQFTGAIASATDAIDNLTGGGGGAGLGSALATGAGVAMLARRIPGVRGRGGGGGPGGGGGGFGAKMTKLFGKMGPVGRFAMKLGPGKAIPLALGAYAVGSQLFGFGPGGAAPQSPYGAAPGDLAAGAAHERLGTDFYTKRSIGRESLMDNVKRRAMFGASVGAIGGTVIPGGGTLSGAGIGLGVGVVGGLAESLLGGGKERYVKDLAAAPRLLVVEKEIAEQVKRRGAALRELLPQYDRITREIGKQKKGSQDYNTLLDERRGLVERIQQEAPGDIRYGRGGQAVGIDRPGIVRDQLGSQAGSKPGRVATARAMRRLQRGRRLVGGAAANLEDVVGRYADPSVVRDLHHAIAAGDDRQIAAITSRTENLGDGAAGAVGAARKTFARSTGLHGSIKTLRDQVKEIQPAFDKYVKTWGKYDEFLKREREREKDGKGGGHFKAGKPGMGGHFEARGGLPVWVEDKPGKKGGKGAKDIVVEGIPAKKKQSKEKGKEIAESYGEGIEAGSKGAQKGADRMIKSIMRDVLGSKVTGPPAKARGLGVMQAFSAGITEGASLAATAAKRAYDGAAGALDSTGTAPSSPNPSGDSAGGAGGGGDTDADGTGGAKRSRSGGRAGRPAAAGRKLGKRLAEQAIAEAASAGAGGEVSTTGLVGQVKRAIAYARRHGWTGGVTSGFRSFAKQTELWNNRASNPNPVARPGTSNHESGQAIDVSDVPGFRRAMETAPPNARLRWYGPGDPVHFSITGRRHGGRIHGNKKGSDSVLARMAPDEFVVTPDGEAQLEELTGVQGVLDMLEKSQKPAFAHGGRGRRKAGFSGGKAIVPSGGGDSFVFYGNLYLGSEDDYQDTLKRLARDLRDQARNMRAEPDEASYV